MEKLAPPRCRRRRSSVQRGKAKAANAHSEHNPKYKKNKINSLLDIFAGAARSSRRLCCRRVAVVIVAVAAVTAADYRLTFKIKLKAVQTARELQISRTPTRRYVDVDFHLGQHNARR